MTNAENNGIQPSSLEVRAARRRVEGAQKAELEAALRVVEQEIVLVGLRGRRAARRDERLDAAAAWRGLDRARRARLAERAKKARAARALEKERRRAERKIKEAKTALAKSRARGGQRRRPAAGQGQGQKEQWK